MKKIKNQIFHGTTCITPKRVTNLRGPSPRHCAQATQLLSKKYCSGREQLRTLCPIWPAWDLNLSLQRRTRYCSNDWPVKKIILLKITILRFLKIPKIFSGPFFNFLLVVATVNWTIAKWFLIILKQRNTVSIKFHNFLQLLWERPFSLQKITKIVQGLATPARPPLVVRTRISLFFLT